MGKRNYAGRVVLCGNPNVGKSTLFNSLTGLKQHTGNWTGKTVELACSEYLHENEAYEVVDLPGTYSLLAVSPEEQIAQQFIHSGDYSCAVIVCDAGLLERNLILALAVLEVCPRAVVCLNLVEEAKRNGMCVDEGRLQQRLGVPVVAVDARKKRTLLALKDAVRNQARATAQHIAPTASAADIAADCVSGARRRKQSKLDKILTNKFLGLPLMLLLLCGIFWITVRGANYPSELLFSLFSYLEGKFSALLGAINAPMVVHDALVYGLFRVCGWIISVMLPPMAIFFPLFTLAEDFGLLPRIAFNLDKPFQKCRACGKQALTMCMGFGCNAAGVVSARIIDCPRERLIAILTNAFVPCNGRFPLLIAVISMFFAASGSMVALLLTGVVLLGVLATFAASRLLSATVLRGQGSASILELPPFRIPQIGKVLVRAARERTLRVLVRAVVVAAPSGLIIFALANTQIQSIPLLSIFSDFLNPAARIIGLDGVILLAFILALPANEIVLPLILMGYTASSRLSPISSLPELGNLLTQNGWSALTALNVLILCLMHFPCSTTLLTIKKETRSIRWTLLAAALPTAFGIALCLITNIAFVLLW